MSPERSVSHVAGLHNFRLPRGGQHAVATDNSRGFPNPNMIHLPVHASWLDQVEIQVSIERRKMLSLSDFPNLDVLANRLHRILDRRQQGPVPRSNGSA